jgi:hypothetical protein
MTRWGRLCACAVASVLAVSATAQVASAQATTIRLEYERGPGAEQCPTPIEVRNGVMARLGRDPFRDADGRRVRVVIAVAGAGLAATVTVHNGQDRAVGERRLTSPHRDCAELAAAVGLALAIVIDPAGAWGRRAERWEESEPASQPQSAPAAVEPPPAAPPAREAPPAATVAVRRAPPVPPRPSEPLVWLASAGPLLSLGAAPGVTAGITLQLAVRRGAWSLALEGRADYPREAAVGGGAVSAFLAAGAVVPCRHFGRFAACGVVLAGGLRGTGRGLADTRADVTPYAAAGARASVEVGLGRRWAIRLQGDLLGTITPTTLTVGSEAVWKSPPVSGAIGLLAAARLR